MKAALAGVDDDVLPTLSEGPVLIRSAPNPFRYAAEISYILPNDGHVTLEIYDVAGRKMATLLDQEQRAGTNRIQWDGRSCDAHPVSSGVYFCRLTVGERISERRMIVLR